MLKLMIAMAALTAQPTVRPTVPVAQVSLPASGPVNEAKAEYVFTVGVCARYYPASERAILLSLAEASSEQERGYLARAFEGGVAFGNGEPITLQACRERLAALAARLRR